ncbi:MAG: NYN domain-containing protein [Gammaproteobacteria bacterium]|nr:NYN domain-containing protein [Gammaproteobacteria bacterium]MDE0269621.1 NYN domain-containing protein [Gammaproteobacteria bacterium]
MPHHHRLAIMLDGGFFTKRFRTLHRTFPGAEDVSQFCKDLMAMECFQSYGLYRTFYYDADPHDGKAVNPISRQAIDFGRTGVANRHRALLDGLELVPDFAVRRGETLFRGWKLGEASLRAIQADPSVPVTDRSFVPNIVQKGVDMRIGLDMAALALKRLVCAVALVTGDADMVPALRFARREGLRTYLHTMGFTGVRRALKAHADIVVP